MEFARLLDAEHVALAGDSALFRYLEQQAERAGRRLRARVRSFDELPRHARQLVNEIRG